MGSFGSSVTLTMIIATSIAGRIDWFVYFLAGVRVLALYNWFLCLFFFFFSLFLNRSSFCLEKNCNSALRLESWCAQGEAYFFFLALAAFPAFSARKCLFAYASFATGQYWCLLLTYTCFSLIQISCVFSFLCFEPTPDTSAAFLLF